MPNVAHLGLSSHARRCYGVMELIGSAHSLGEANFPVQFTPRYRRDVFRDGEVRRACEESFRETAARCDFAIHAVEFGTDHVHVHVFVGACKNLAVSELARLLKGASSRRVRRECWERVEVRLWGTAFWSGGYFYRSVGSTMGEAIRHCIEKSQKKQWAALDCEEYKQGKDAQTTINQFIT